jgi:hypothetical protein
VALGSVGRCGRVLLLTLAVASSTSAAAIAFTVQVIAVSDQETALSISRELLREGFPTYVVRSTGAQGDVYRVRVGAFANRSAALLYAESMPEVGGSRPVPALAEAIPEGIMPLAPRLLWHGSWESEDVRVMPWPGGVALRIQRGDPLRQALYLVFQDGEERRFEAWHAVPLAAMPAAPRPPELEVPMIDLTLPRPALDESRPGPQDRPAESGEPAAPEDLAAEDTEPGGAEPGDAESDDAGPEELEADDAAPDDGESDDAAPDATEPEAAEPDAAVADAAEPDGPDDPTAPDLAVAEAEPEDPAAGALREPAEAPAPPEPATAPEPPEAATPLERFGAVLADPGDEAPEVGLLLLRDRALWPPAWEGDAEEARQAFRGSLSALIARELGLSEQRIEALAYHPGGELPPSVVVLDLSDASARDAGRIVALGDPSAGMHPFGPPQLVPDDWSLPDWPATRIRRDTAPPDPLVGPDWVVAVDDGFLRLSLSDGTSWRAGVGAPLWTDGRVVLSWDGERLLLYDFVLR